MPSGSVAIEALYRDQWPALLRLAFFLVGERAMAEDVVQDAFLRLDTKKQLPEHPEAYLRTVVVNLVRDRRRRAALERTHLPPPPAPVFNSELEELWQRLWKLPVRERQALVLRYCGDLSLAELAEHLGCPLGTAKSLIHRGLAALRARAGDDR